MSYDNIQWTEDYVISLVENKVEENLHLEYKSCAALSNTEETRQEISKDISAFANSDGGTIIYGVLEDRINRHLPEQIDLGYDQKKISKEWLEQIIHTNISRKVPDIRIYPIELTKTNPGHYIYVVEVPQSRLAPHQAKDKKFYKRYNLKLPLWRSMKSGIS